jgi:transcriptional regulator with XRE-family HTH domain
MEYSKEVVDRINQIMKENGLDQRSLANQLSIAQPTVSNILNLKRSPNALIDRIVEKYGVEKTWLLYGIGNKFKATQPEAFNKSSDDLSITERVALINKLNALYERHQSIMSEEQDIMKSIVEINKKLLLAGVDIAGI